MTKTTTVSKAAALRRAQIALIRDDISIINQGILRNGNLSNDSGSDPNKFGQLFLAIWQWLTQLAGNQDTVVVILPFTGALPSSIPTLEEVSDRSGIPTMFIFNSLTSLNKESSLKGPQHPYYWAPFILLGHGL